MLHVIMGPPAAGKSAFVREHSAEGEDRPDRQVDTPGEDDERQPQGQGREECGLQGDLAEIARRSERRKGEGRDDDEAEQNHQRTVALSQPSQLLDSCSPARIGESRLGGGGSAHVFLLPTWRATATTMTIA